MNITAIIPTTGEHQVFVDQAIKLMERQTRQPDDVIIVQSPMGVTGNIRTGFKQSGDGWVAVIEHDDYYPPDYLEFSEKFLTPDLDIFGYETTFYYHLALGRYRSMFHKGRSSMFQTFINRSANINWPDDSEKFLDRKLWKDKGLKNSLYYGSKAVGIKHGIGKTAGAGHRKTFNYPIEDRDLEFLRDVTSNDPFYLELINRLTVDALF